MRRPDPRWIVLALGVWCSSSAAGETLFGYRVSAAPTLAAFPVWRELLARIDAEREGYHDCADGCDTLRGRLWRNYLAREGEPVTPDLLWEINRFVNTFPRRPQATPPRAPRAFLDGGGSEWEAAVMKYVTLRELGLDERRMALVAGRDVLADRPHPLLAVTLEETPLILDARTDTILDDRAVTYFEPRLGLNARGRTLYLPPPENRP